MNIAKMVRKELADLATDDNYSIIISLKRTVCARHCCIRDFCTDVKNTVCMLCDRTDEDVLHYAESLCNTIHDVRTQSYNRDCLGCVIRKEVE